MARHNSWTYDAIGNRLTSTVNGVTTNYTYQKIGANPLNWQRLTSDGTSSYGYDGNGNTQTRTGSTFTWNYDDRMTGVTGTSSYAYDYQGRRSGKTVGASTSSYLYDGLNLIQEAGATPADYLFGPGIDEPLAMSRSGSIYYDLVDGLGSVSLVTNATGGVQDKYLYDAWGQTRSSTTPVVNPFGYTARELGEAGTLFYRARYYQTSIGRFLSEDPLAQGPIGYRHNASSFQPLYVYVENSPSRWSDPLGLSPFEGPPVDFRTPNDPDFNPVIQRSCYGNDQVVLFAVVVHPDNGPRTYEQQYAKFATVCNSFAVPPYRTYVGAPQVTGGIGILVCCIDCTLK